MALKDFAPLIAPIVPVLVTRKCCAIYYLSSHTARTASAGCAILLHKTLEKQVFYSEIVHLSFQKRSFGYSAIFHVLRSASTIQPSDIEFSGHVDPRVAMPPRFSTPIQPQIPMLTSLYGSLALFETTNHAL